MGRNMRPNLTFVVISFLSFQHIFADDQIHSGRDGRFSIFNIIKFENSPCVGGTRNGTCFTAAECEDNGGTTDGDCADGFGVCCTVILSNGQATSLNQSYIVFDTTTTTTDGDFTYRICPCSSAVCRMRFDFTSFTIAGPYTAEGTRDTATATNPADRSDDTALGKCQQDHFSVTGSSGSGTPVICGVNTGQHVYVDSDGSQCSTVNMGQTGTFAARMYDIMVTQYRCGEENGGPPGCLQYFQETTGQIRSFNFPNQALQTNVDADVTHLANQHYTSCIRTAANFNTICYHECTILIADTVANGIIQSSFGVSLSPAAAANSGVGTDCTQDYITIPNGNTQANAVISANINTVAGNSRYCGRVLNSVTSIDENMLANHLSVCSTQVPFRLGVDFDDTEVTNAGAAGDAMTDEAEVQPGGIIGFCLQYAQSAL